MIHAVVRKPSPRLERLQKRLQQHIRENELAPSGTSVLPIFLDLQSVELTLPLTPATRDLSLQ